MILNENISPEILKTLSTEEKEQLCGEIRSYLIETISKNGGHLASSLGTVELCVAMHSVFSTPTDKIIFDVGHQAYAHKILTGRMARFTKIRTENGVSGFPRPDESEHDAFIAGHAGISVSAALGIAKAMKLRHEEGNVVAVVGDGAFTCGEIYEGLNNAGMSKDNLIVILNDNEMCISKSKGALATYLSGITSTKKYYDTKKNVKHALSHSVLGQSVSKSISGTKKLMKNVIYQNNMFENLGFHYIGPVDGHNLSALEEAMNISKDIAEPCIIHVMTTKGKGFSPAELNSGEYHGVDKNNGKAQKVQKPETYSEVYGKVLLELGREDERICAVTAAMKYATGSQYFAKEFRDRFFDAGIAEEHAMTFSAGLASQGMIPFYAVYSTFMQRCVDQLIHDAAIEKLHVVLAVDRAGLVGEDGETHQGIFDVALLSCVPDIVIYSPSSSESLRACLRKAAFEEKGPVVVRYPRGVAYNGATEPVTDYKLYKAKRNENDCLAVTYGRISNYAKRLTENNVDVLKLVKIYPIENEIIEIVRRYKKIVFFEEAAKQGGIGEKLLLKLVESGYRGDYNVRAIDNSFVKCADVESQVTHFGLDLASMREEFGAD